MKNLLLLIALSFGLVVSTSFGKDKEPTEDELLRKSQLSEPAIFNSGSTSFPRNFTPTSAWASPQNAAVSTGYYWIDDRETLDPILFPDMRPSPSKIDTGYQPELWRKIVAGPRVLTKTYWENNRQEGWAFFRQPADGDSEGSFWDNPIDSTDEAIAGPIPLGIQGGFYFNGIRYDSFYVSTNGLIALTNRRYFYDANGQRVIPTGAESAYDPMSMDWFAGGFRGRDTLWLRNWLNTQDSINPNTQQRIVVRDENGNVLFKNGLTDPIPDNFGYQFSVLGASPVSIGFDRTVPTNGIRARGGDMITGIDQNSKTAMIAPFWGDMMLSQYNPTTKNRQEHGKVWYKRTASRDSLIVAIYNIQPKGNLVAALNAGAPIMATVPADARPGDPTYATADAHVVLSAVDSSITIHYTRITDSVEYLDPSTAIYVKGAARELFRYNTTAGVRGFARHVNFGKGGITNNDPWAGEYIQATTYWDRYRSDTLNPEVMYPTTMSAVKFKQWKNTLRVQSLNYRVRSRVPSYPQPSAYVLDVPVAEMDDYELLAGHDRLGQIQPFAIVQNLSNEIQGPDGVNFMPQDHSFRVRFLVRNTVTNRAIYNRVVPVNANCLSLPEAQSADCNGDQTIRVRLVRGTQILTDNDFRNLGFQGVPAYYGAQVQFPPFEPNQFVDEHIGKMRAMAIAEPVYPANNASYEDHWPFDDTVKTTMFVMRRFYDQNPDARFRVFDDDASEWFIDMETGKYMPSVWKWVNINAEVVAGDQVSKYPTPPRGPAVAKNYDLGVIQNPVALESPTIRMNRLQLDGTEPLLRYQDNRSPRRGGDEIRSFPIDLRGKQGAVLTLSIQRTAHRDNWVRGYNDRLLVGPEPRVVQQGNVLNPYIFGNSVSQTPDELVVEFARPSDDEINGITNIPLANWRHHPQRRGVTAGAITNMAALTLYGAGGYLIGFLEKNDKDSALALPGTVSSGQINSLRANLYDDGIDVEYKKFAIPIPDTFIVWRNNGAKHFRFRVKVYAIDSRKCATCIRDDADDFFVDNVRLLYRSEITDLEITSVKVNWPYTLAPASQTTFMPLTVTISNNTDLNAANFAVKLKIFRVDENGNFLDDAPIYCRTQTVSNLTPSGTLDLTMPAWNARKSQTDTIAHYRLVANLIGSEPDLIPKNDTTWSDFTLRFSDQFAYDPPVEKVTNDVDDFITPAGKGLNFLVPVITVPNPIPGLPPIPRDSPRAGSGNLNSTTISNFDFISDAVGAVGGSGSGSIAVRFKLLNSDTLKGFRIYWAGLNKAANQVTIKVHEGNELLPSQNRIIESLTTRRGGPNFANIYDQYVDYPFNEPLILARGVYWISVAQDGESGYEVGVSKARSAMRTTNVYQDPVAPNWWGEQGIALNLDKNFRTMVDGNLVNDNVFAFQNVINIGNWIPFTPAMGNPAFAHMTHHGFRGFDNTTFTLTRGTWIPHVRPIFGYKSFGESADEFQWCDPSDIIPVELYVFTGGVRTSGIDLYWETASEINNYGFFVERRIAGKNEEFKQIGFVSGVGNATTISRYNFLDKDVTPKTTYEYRLRQMDRDGSQECFTSNIVTLTFDRIGEMTLEPNSPNPFTNLTMINFNLPEGQNVKLEVIDMFGNVVRILENGFLGAKNYSYSFDGQDAMGNQLPTGTYIYRLSAEKEILSGKMSIVR
ncbi:MAG: T9SS type A sorting domain-containing protein [Candidatus Kapabacteria bacterium]|nr:T9SS type A sorting domain-containing protein [Ignavibacteriota bacterium]MCW5884365.1 T9SS type A sorting domain-containing protein [Candidatus Kapabacteria bacterium]